MRRTFEKSFKLQFGLCGDTVTVNVFSARNTVCSYLARADRLPMHDRGSGTEGNVVFVQWNLSKADTLGTNIFVRISRVSTLYRLYFWDFDQ